MSAVRPPLRRDHHRRDVLLAVGVGFAMTVIVGLYAASFRGMIAAESDGRDALPRWDAVSQDFFESVGPTITQLSDARSQLADLLQAKAAQAQAVDILKAKIASASATPEAPPETPNP